jgi:hypothetical protein
MWPDFDFVVVSVDSAFTKKEENDPTGCTTWGVWTDPADGYPRVMASPPDTRRGAGPSAGARATDYAASVWFRADAVLDDDPLVRNLDEPLREQPRNTVPLSGILLQRKHEQHRLVTHLAQFARLRGQ